MTNNRRIPFIPKQSTHFEDMRYRQTVSDLHAESVSRSTFLRLSSEQPCPLGQTYIDIEDGYAYLFPFDASKADAFVQQNTETAKEYKRWYREQERIRNGKLTIVHLDDNADEGSDSLVDLLASSDKTDARIEEAAEREILTAAFSSLTHDEIVLLRQFRKSGFNYRELSRLTGKDHSGLAKRIKRIHDRYMAEVARRREK